MTQPPKLENGHTRIANAILEALCHVNLSAYESRVLFFVFRATYGWNRKDTETSVMKISKVTGLDRRHVQRALKSLEGKNLVNLRRTGENKTGKGLVIGFQKYLNRWTVYNPVDNLKLPAPKEARAHAPKSAQGYAPESAHAMFSKPRF